jgi:hypothetical protein
MKKHGARMTNRDGEAISVYHPESQIASAAAGHIHEFINLLSVSPRQGEIRFHPRVPLRISPCFFPARTIVAGTVESIADIILPG